MPRLASALVALVLGASTVGPVSAQLFPPGGPRGSSPPAAQGPACIRLEAELARLDRPATYDPSVLRDIEDQIGRQRADLDRAIAQGQRLGCDRQTFFLFGPPDRHPRCPQIDAQVMRLRQGLDTAMRELQRARGGEREIARRQLLAALAQNNCGPQYRAAMPAPQQQRPQNFFEMLFGRPAVFPQDEDYEDVPAVGTYRTLCVRTCDGFYFPISFSATPSKFREDERVCRAQCPAAEVMLFAHRNPGEDVSQALSIAGKPYTDMPNAFKYREFFNSSCSCKPANQTWAEAIGHLDKTVQRGDIIVTEERSKAMQQQAMEPPRPAEPQASPRPRERDRRNARQPTPPPPDPVASLPPPPDPAPLAPELKMSGPSDAASQSPTSSIDGRRQVRVIGPNAYPAR